MRSIVTFSFALLAVLQSVSASPAQILERAACNGDNCLNALKKASAVNTKDCQSFMTRTTTPCPYSTTTTTTTATVTKTIGSAPHNKREDIAVEARAPAATTGGTCPSSTTATAAPTYASACSGAVRYSSACSCLGVTSGTTTIASPLATSTVTATSTSTVTAVCSTFLATATSGTFAGQYLAYGATHGEGSYPDALSFVPDVARADLIVANGTHFFGGNSASSISSGSLNSSRIWRANGESYIEEAPGNPKYPQTYAPVDCMLTAIALDGTAKITCASNTYYYGNATDFQTCPGPGYDTTLLLYQGLADDGEGPPCTLLDLVTIPKC